MSRYVSRCLVACCCGVLTASWAAAQEPQLADPAGAPLIAPVEPAEEEQVLGKRTADLVVPIQNVAGPVCHPIAVADVRTKLSARRLMRRGGPPIHLSVCVDNPVDCCETLYSVPLCVPACCVGPPTVCNPRPGVLPGRGKVDVVWRCGFVATVTFLKHGGVIITYAAP